MIYFHTPFGLFCKKDALNCVITVMTATTPPPLLPSPLGTPEKGDTVKSMIAHVAYNLTEKKNINVAADDEFRFERKNTTKWFLKKPGTAGLFRYDFRSINKQVQLWSTSPVEATTTTVEATTTTVEATTTTVEATTTTLDSGPVGSVTWSATRANVEIYNNTTGYPWEYWFPLSLSGQLDQADGETYLFQNGDFSGGTDWSRFFGSFRLAAIPSGVNNLNVMGGMVVFRTYVDGEIDVEVENYNSTHLTSLIENKPFFTWTAGKTGKLTKFEFLVVQNLNNPKYAQGASGSINKAS